MYLYANLIRKTKNLFGTIILYLFGKKIPLHIQIKKECLGITAGAEQKKFQ